MPASELLCESLALPGLTTPLAFVPVSCHIDMPEYAIMCFVKFKKQHFDEI